MSVFAPGAPVRVQPSWPHPYRVDLSAYDGTVVEGPRKLWFTESPYWLVRDESGNCDWYRLRDLAPPTCRRCRRPAPVVLGGLCAECGQELIDDQRPTESDGPAVGAEGLF